MPGSRADARCAASCIKTCTTLDDLGWPSGWRVSSPRNAFSHLRIWDVPPMLPRKKTTWDNQIILWNLFVGWFAAQITRHHHLISSPHPYYAHKHKKQKKQSLMAVTSLTLSHATRWWRCCRCASVGLSLDQISQRQGTRGVLMFFDPNASQAEYSHGSRPKNNHVRKSIINRPCWGIDASWYHNVSKSIVMLDGL